MPARAITPSVLGAVRPPSAPPVVRNLPGVAPELVACAWTCVRQWRLLVTASARVLESARRTEQPITLAYSEARVEVFRDAEVVIGQALVQGESLRWLAGWMESEARFWALKAARAQDAERNAEARGRAGAHGDSARVLRRALATR